LYTLINSLKKKKISLFLSQRKLTPKPLQTNSMIILQAPTSSFALASGDAIKTTYMATAFPATSYLTRTRCQCIRKPYHQPHPSQPPKRWVLVEDSLNH